MPVELNDELSRFGVLRSDVGVRFPEGLVAFWDFSETAAPFRSKRGAGEFPLVNGLGSSVAVVPEGPFGQSISLNGVSDYLVIPASDTGALNLSRVGDECTVVAWVNLSEVNFDFIAGMWQEDDNNPKRQYGLFVDLPLYGGDNRVCGHVSYTGGPTPGYPFSRDYSTSARQVSPSGWRMVAFTYDGNNAISYLDGVADQVPTYTDGNGKTYAKNPYVFDNGLNRSSVSDFTVGAVKLTGGMGNFLGGLIGGIAIFDKALGAEDIMRLHMATLQTSEPLIAFDFYTTTGVGVNIAPIMHGWKSAEGPTAIDKTNDSNANCFTVTTIGSNKFMYRSANASVAIGYVDTIKGMRLSQLRKVTFDLNNAAQIDKVRVVLKVGNSWYASAQTFSVTGNGRTGADWSTSENKEFLIDRQAAAWLELSFTPGSTLSLGTTPVSDLPNGELGAIGLFSPSCTGTVRIDNFKLFDR